MKNSRKALWQAFGLAILVMSFIAVSSLMAESVILLVSDFGCRYLMGCEQGSSFKPLLLVTAGMFFLLLGLILLISLASLRKRWFGSTAAMLRKSDDVSRKVVIMGLSYFSACTKALDTHPDDLGVALESCRELKSLIDFGYQKASLSIEEMIEHRMLVADGSRWVAAPEFPGVDCTWVQNLRALRRHIDDDTLEYVFIVPSHETERSAPLFKMFLERLLEEVLKSEIRIEIADRGADYDNFEDVKNALIRTLESGRGKRGKDGKRITDRDICIDATSGKATFSIGAALVTLNHDTLYSYVTTVQPPPGTGGGKPLFYDATVDLAAFMQEA